MIREHTFCHLLSYLIIALIAGFLGFGVAIEGTAATIAKVLCLVFVTLFVVALLFEIGGTIAGRVRNLLSSWAEVEIRSDLQGIARVAIARRTLRERT